MSKEKKESAKKEVQVRTIYSRIRNIAIISSFFVILAFSCFACALIFGQVPIEHLFWSTNHNPFIHMINKPNEFFKDTKNIIFLSLMCATFLFIFIGGLLLPLINVLLANKQENKAIFRGAVLSSPLVLAVLPLFPLVWWIANLMVITKSTKEIKQLKMNNVQKAKKEEVQENKNEEKKLEAEKNNNESTSENVNEENKVDSNLIPALNQPVGNPIPGPVYIPNIPRPMIRQQINRQYIGQTQMPIGPIPMSMGPMPRPMGPMPRPMGPMPRPMGPMPRPIGPIPRPMGPMPRPMGQTLN